MGGVDTHRDAHTAAAIDSAGRLLDTASFPATRSGYEQLLGWLRGLGGVERVRGWRAPAATARAWRAISPRRI